MDPEEDKDLRTNHLWVPSPSRKFEAPHPPFPDMLIGHGCRRCGLSLPPHSWLPSSVASPLPSHPVPQLQLLPTPTHPLFSQFPFGACGGEGKALREREVPDSLCPEKSLAYNRCSTGICSSIHCPAPSQPDPGSMSPPTPLRFGILQIWIWVLVLPLAS